MTLLQRIAQVRFEVKFSGALDLRGKVFAISGFEFTEFYFMISGHQQGKKRNIGEKRGFEA
ncbi:MAG: hypothetical protein ETSY2_08970 [Candidatus Entotheonella gemina]|uniref:Uncharacterized protein n=1 Tax=Candidatus Entotheonella gemina TaxID=1429439 RepID=W4MCC1_9BACT|nr:MAG: hypothetical protein ETSY2_08970 [Candidatus Entotheonella gemina]